MNNFAMILVLAVCTLAAMPGARAASCVDSDECADLNVDRDLCGRTIFGRKVNELCPVACKQCAAAIRAARSTTTPTISTSEGNVKLQAANGKQVMVVKDDGTEINLSDALTATDAVPQFKSQERRAESTEEQLKGLLQALQTTFTANVDVTGKASRALVEELALFRDTVANQTAASASAAAAAQQSSADPLLKDKIYWLMHNKLVLPTNEAGFDTRVVGLGFEAYYNPYFVAMFTCVYSVAGDKGGKLTATTPGKVLADAVPGGGSTYSIVCASPQYVPEKRTYALAVFYEDANGKRSIPFKGIKGRDGMLFDMVWTKANFVNNEVIVDVNGFDIKKSYVCEYVDEANSNIKKITDSKFLDNNKYKLNCGKQPTGFTIKLTSQRVKLSIKLKGTSTVATYGGTGNTVIELPTCQNSVKDGAESDVDCGGLCKQKCGPQKKCTKGGDCFNNMCINNKCGGKSGSSQSEAAESCKQIARDYPKAKNGRYWVRGVGNTVAPFKVFCWLVDRLGGGWTLGFTNGYQWCHTASGAQGNVDGNVLGNRKQCYKMADDKIRAVIGQKSGQSSKFDVMQDQSTWDRRYSNGNYEYNVMLGYTERWHFTHWTPVGPSKTKVSFRSYYWNSDFDGTNTKGEGTLNWKGTVTNCGGGSNGGIRCYGNTQGDSGFSSSPNGGRGCKKNKSYNNWSGRLHWYMSHSNHDTYTFVCNGAQHTSGYHFNHRWWFRSGDDKST